MGTEKQNGERPSSFSVPGYEDEVNFGGASAEQIAKIFESAEPELTEKSQKILLITGTPGQIDSESEKFFKRG